MPVSLLRGLLAGALLFTLAFPRKTTFWRAAPTESGSSTSTARTRVTLKVLPRADAVADEVWLRPYVAPVLNFRRLAGKAPANGAVNCTVKMETRERADHKDRVVVLECEDGLRLELQGMDLGN